MIDIFTNKEKNTDMKFLIIIICIVPILSPYALFGVSLSFLLVLVALLMCLLKYRSVYMHKMTGIMLFYMFTISIVNILFTINRSLNVALCTKVFIVFLIYLLFYSSAWNIISDSQDFFSIASMLGKIFALLAIVQFIAASLGYTNFYSGRLPFALEEYSTFASLVDPTTGALRVHSFFEEPSYLAIYELPVFAYLFRKEDYLWSAVVAFSCVASGSALGIVGIIIVTIVLFLGSTISVNHKVRIIFIILAIILLFMIILNKSPSLQNLLRYYMRRYLNIGRDFARDDSSVSQRIVGNFPLFSKYNLYNKIFGVGINQYPIYFNLSKDYSNDFVSNLLNFGYLGIVILVFWLSSLIKECKKKNIVYFVIIILVLSIDHIWFSDNFFYLLSWLILGGKRIGYVNLKLRK